MQHATAFIVGLIFAVGLGISGMTQPEKVIGFLDFTGNWDGSLAFVMGGATIMYFFFFRVVRGYAPVLTAHFHLPTKTLIDKRLIIGSAMFGVGWGLAGFCPGPALTSIGTGSSGPLLFVASMITGMYLFALFNHLTLKVAASKQRAEPPSINDAATADA